VIQLHCIGRKMWLSIISFFRRDLPPWSSRSPLLRTSLWCAVFIMIAAHPQSTFGQGEQGIITGTVTDQSGAVVAGAKVAVREVSTQTASTTTTNARGYYTIPYLNPEPTTLPPRRTGSLSQPSQECILP
jgi:hypothetical protein